ncbi:MAG: hypothetical protein O3C40_23490 [Planctomycetota bacterium]|nr:hypothetical protein [Planctomycetota bacterium]
MLRFIALPKAVGGKLFKGFMHSRLLAELPGADDLIQVQTDHPSDDPRMGNGLYLVGVL